MNPWEQMIAQQQEDQAWRKKNLHPADMPAYASLIDPATGQLQSQYTLGSQPDIAFDPNIQNNPWVKMMLSQNDLNRSSELDKTGAANNAGLAQSFSALASRGGLSSGARLNLAKKSARDLMMGKQNVNMSADKGRLDLMTSGMEKQATLDSSNRDYKTNVEKTNLQTMLMNKQSQDDYNMNKYKTQMEAWGADRTANAQENAGKK